MKSQTEPKDSKENEVIFASAWRKRPFSVFESSGPRFFYSTDEACSPKFCGYLCSILL